jgi:hypothetical protein
MIKFGVNALCIIAIGAILYGFYEMFTGNYLYNAPFNGSILFVLGIVIIGVIAKSLRTINSMFALLSIAVLSGCSYAKSNQQVLISGNCGKDWEMISAGEHVPAPGVNPCYMKVVIPNYSMQGESVFISNLKDRVRANVHIDYDYAITDPLAFIREARYLGKANAEADSDDALDDSAFEGAENKVIDKRIRDVAKGILLTQDIVELDQGEIEDELLEKANARLHPIGIQLNFITLTFDLDEQTRQAIDISTAMKIYESKQIKELGEKVMSAKAGAPRITVDTKTIVPKEE